MTLYIVFGVGLYTLYNACPNYKIKHCSWSQWLYSFFLCFLYSLGQVIGMGCLFTFLQLESPGFALTWNYLQFLLSAQPLFPIKGRCYFEGKIGQQQLFAPCKGFSVKHFQYKGKVRIQQYINNLKLHHVCIQYFINCPACQHVVVAKMANKSNRNTK